MSAHSEFRETQQEVMLDLKIKTDDFMKKLIESRRTTITFGS